MKMKKGLGLGILAVLLGIWATGSPAIAAFIDFSGLPAPGPTPLVLPGVTFTPAYIGGISVDPNFTRGDRAYLSSLPSSVPNTYDLVTITFDTPVFLVKFSVWPYQTWSLDPSYVDYLPPQKWWFEAQDINGKVIDRQVQVGSPPVNSRMLVVLCSKGIKTVTIKIALNDYADPVRAAAFIDDFSFYPLAPSATIIPIY